jgi:SAM-dependent methyltransferase
MIDAAVIWHDVECGGYEADLPLWRELAREAGGPVLEVGAGTGRVALRLARAGHEVTALDRDALLLSVLEDRARDAGLDVETVVADAASFDLESRGFALIAVPMQTVQLLPGAEARAGFLSCARRALAAGGLVAAALADAPEPFAPPGDLPLPDMAEHDGWRFISQPMSIRWDERSGGEGEARDRNVWRIERARQAISPDGTRTTEDEVVELAAITAEDLEREGAAAGLRPDGVRLVAETADHVGSEVVLLRG